MKKTTVIDAAPLQERDLRNFLQRYISNEQVKISKEAFDLFLRLTDFDLSKAMNEIEKLLLLAGEGGTITLQLVQDLVPKTLEHNIFELTEQILKGYSKSLSNLRRAPSSGGGDYQIDRHLDWSDPLALTNKNFAKNRLSAGQYR